MIAKYPFLKDSVEFLTTRHNNSYNYDQAQYRKSEEQRQGMRLVHKELVEKDFKKKLSDCDEDIVTVLLSFIFGNAYFTHSQT